MAIASVQTRRAAAEAMPNKITIQVQVHDSVPRKSDKPFGLMLMESRTRASQHTGATPHRGSLDRPSLREVKPTAAKRVRE
jgi:hypothetical protein